MFCRPETTARIHTPVKVDFSSPAEQALEEAIIHTVTYSDVFDYPLTPEEIHRYLVGVPASLDQVCAALENGSLVGGRLEREAGYYYLAGREGLVAKRLHRTQISAALWPKAVHYGLMIARMPFVRMVAITGALSMNSSDVGDDLDYFVVTDPGRLWLCRAFVIGLVHAAARRGDIICPNYFVSTRALVVTDRNLYTAHEMAQMMPVAGMALYQQMRDLNPWVERFLPNACGAPRAALVSPTRPHPVWALAEAVLRTPSGAWLERWEMDRKVMKLKTQTTAGDLTEADFSPDWCKGHFGGYGRRTLEAMTERMSGEV